MIEINQNQLWDSFEERFVYLIKIIKSMVDSCTSLGPRRQMLLDEIKTRLSVKFRNIAPN